MKPKIFYKVQYLTINSLIRVLLYEFINYWRNRNVRATNCIASPNKGYQVRCLVRNFRKASFLKEWGVELVYGDLTRPETIPPCLKGITAIIDASTSRPNELDTLKKVDWDGKLCLIEAAKAANINLVFACALRIH